MSRILRLVLIASLSLNAIVIVGGGIAAYRWFDAKAAVKKMRVSHHTTYYRSRQTHFDTLTRRGGIIFLGDSLTDFCEWQELLDTPGIANRGIMGDTIEGVADRLDSIARQQPRKLFVLIGSNNLLAGEKPEALLPRYRALAARIRQTMPATTLYLLSIPPTISRHSNIAPETIKAVNKGLMALADGGAVRYVDLFSAIADERGEMIADYTFDGGHFNGRGYEALRRVLAPLVR